MKIRDIMTGQIELVHPETPITDAANKMLKYDTGALPVGAEGKLVGILTDRDIALRAVAQDGNCADFRVGDVMTREVRTVHPDQDADTAAELMARLQLRRLPVLDSDQKLVGMLSLGDLARTRPPTIIGETLHAISEAASQ